MHKQRPLYQSPRDPRPEDEMLAAARRIRARQQAAADTQDSALDEAARKSLIAATLLRCIADEIDGGLL